MIELEKTVVSHGFSAYLLDWLVQLFFKFFCEPRYFSHFITPIRDTFAKFVVYAKTKRHSYLLQNCHVILFFSRYFLRSSKCELILPGTCGISSWVLMFLNVNLLAPHLWFEILYFQPFQTVYLLYFQNPYAKIKHTYRVSQKKHTNWSAKTTVFDLHFWNFGCR